MRILFLFLFLSITGYAFSGNMLQTSENVQQEVISETQAAPAPLEFDREEINSLKQDPEFDYTEVKVEENWWTRFKRYLLLQWQRFLSWLSGDHNINEFVLFLFELLPYLLIAAILLFAIWLFAKLNPAGSYLKDPKTAGVFLNEEEEIVQSRNINKLIEEAVAASDYRLAVRFHYLLILQKLSEAGLIDYQYSKTDEEYLAEIQAKELGRQFSQITRIYDFIWYGNFAVSAGNYPRAKKEFEQMQEQIKKGNEQKV